MQIQIKLNLEFYKRKFFFLKHLFNTQNCTCDICVEFVYFVNSLILHLKETVHKCVRTVPSLDDFSGLISLKYFIQI